MVRAPGPDGGRWCKSDIGADGGEKERAPTSCLAGARSAWSGQKGTGNCEGHSQLVADEPTPRVAMRFPHTQESARDGQRCHTSAGEEVIPAPALRRSVVCRGRPARWTVHQIWGTRRTEGGIAAAHPCDDRLLGAHVATQFLPRLARRRNGRLPETGRRRDVRPRPRRASR